MFSVFSRLGKNSSGAQNGNKNSAPAPMSVSLQKKFSRGVHYNMKIVIKGDRNVGKSCLLQRLQGSVFIEDYRPTEQIQVAPINWMYKNTDYIVKVEVWEVVDKAQTKKKTPQVLKFENNVSGTPDTDVKETPQLDATFIDVYKNANGVILMLDITKPWTFDYVQRELVNIPSEIPVIILGNHCDMNHHRQVHPQQIEYTIENQQRSGSVRYTETSMRNGFGLRLLHKWLNVPFLQLQQSSLLAQLTTNQKHTEAAHEELDLFQNSEEADYNSFLEKLASKRRSENTIPIASKQYDRAPSIVLGGGKPILPNNLNPLVNSSVNKTSVKSYVPNSSTGSAPRLQDNTPGAQKTTNRPPVMVGSNLEDFNAGDLDNSFLDDFSSSSKDQLNRTLNAEETSVPRTNIDSDEEGDNPLVYKVQEDVDIGSSDEDLQSSARNLDHAPTSNVDGAHQTIPSPQEVENRNAKFPVTMNYSSENIFTPYLPTPNECSSENKLWTNMSMEKLSVSDVGRVNSDHSEEDGETMYYNESGRKGNQSSLYLSDSAQWQLNANIRRSPEGGEDVSPTAGSESTKDKKNKDKKKHKKLKKSKDKEKSRKSRDGKEDKTEGKQEESCNRKDYDDLENFLNEDTPSLSVNKQKHTKSDVYS